jgi:C-terminal processing protease CtpA/Prc
MGEYTRHTAGDPTAVTFATRAALGASYDADVQTIGNVREEVIEVMAPAGKLGVVIDTPDDGAPIVHAVKDSSVIADQINVGDKLIAVDDVDVRSMTAIKVSKLISKKSSNPTRKLTIVRTTVVD